MSEFRPLESQYNVGDARFAIVTARWNGAITDNLREGALRTLARHAVAEQQITDLRVPGAFELPLVCKTLAASGRYAAVIALGAVIRGDTPHFDYVCAECARGIGEAALQTGVPVMFGVIKKNPLLHRNLAHCLTPAHTNSLHYLKF